MKSHFEITGLTFAFDKKEPSFFKDMHVAFKPGIINFIQGDNGVGKSTLFRILQGDIHTSEYGSGTITINENQYKLPNRVTALKEHVGLIDQQPVHMIADQFTFEQNIQLALLEPHPFLRTMPALPQLPDFIKKIAIDYTKPAYLLSGGQKQILSIIMMLQKKKAVILLDEPTAALDETNSHLVFDFLNTVASNSSVIIVVICHDKDLIQRYCNGTYFKLSKENATRVLKEITFQ